MINEGTSEFVDKDAVVRSSLKDKDAILHIDNENKDSVSLSSSTCKDNILPTINEDTVFSHTITDEDTNCTFPSGTSMKDVAPDPNEIDNKVLISSKSHGVKILPNNFTSDDTKLPGMSEDQSLPCNTEPQNSINDGYKLFPSAVKVSNTTVPDTTDRDETFFLDSQISLSCFTESENNTLPTDLDTGNNIRISKCTIENSVLPRPNDTDLPHTSDESILSNALTCEDTTLRSSTSVDDTVLSSNITDDIMVLQDRNTNGNTGTSTTISLSNDDGTVLQSNSADRNALFARNNIINDTVISGIDVESHGGQDAVSDDSILPDSSDDVEIFKQGSEVSNLKPNVDILQLSLFCGIL